MTKREAAKVLEVAAARLDVVAGTDTAEVVGRMSREERSALVVELMGRLDRSSPSWRALCREANRDPDTGLSLDPRQVAWRHRMAELTAAGYFEHPPRPARPVGTEETLTAAEEVELAEALEVEVPPPAPPPPEKPPREVVIHWGGRGYTAEEWEAAGHATATATIARDWDT